MSRKASSTMRDTLLFVAPALALALVAALYISGLAFEYVYDDRLIFIASRRLRDGWASVRNIGMPVIANTTYFRPAVMLSFVTEFSLFGAVASISKTINLALHLGNCFLVYKLSKRLFLLGSAFAPTGPNTYRVSANFAAVFALVFYGLHPSLIESVTWVSGRFDLMVTLFSLLAILLATGSRQPPVKAWLGASFLLALFSKEMAITLPVIIFLMRLPAKRADELVPVRSLLISEWRAVLSILTITGIVYLLIRASFFPSMLHVDPTVMGELTGPVSRAGLVAHSLLFYLRLAIYPYRDTTPMHPFDVSTIGDFNATNALAWLVLLVAVSLPFLAGKTRSVSFWLLCALPVSLLPVLNIIPLRLGGSIGENRFLTFPLALLLIIAAFFVGRLVRSGARPARLATLAISSLATFLVIGNIAFVHATLPIWRNDLTLFTSTFREHPSSGRAALQYLRAAFQDGQLQQAMSEIESSKAAKVFPDAFEATYAVSLAQLGRRDEAILHFENAVHRLDSDGLPNMEALRWYTEVMQSWGLVDAAEAKLAQTQKLHAARANAEDSYFVIVLEIRQAILRGQSDIYGAKLQELKTAANAEVVATTLDSIRRFRDVACQTPKIAKGNVLCIAQGAVK